MVETVENILRVTTFIAAGGTVAIVFFFIFAEVIVGSRRTHKQMNQLIEQNQQILDELKEISKNTSQTDKAQDLESNNKS